MMIQAVKIARLFAAAIVQVHVKEHLLQVYAPIVADLVKVPALVPAKEVHPTLVVRVAHQLAQIRVRMNVALHAQESVLMDVQAVVNHPAQEIVRANVVIPAQRLVLTTVQMDAMMVVRPAVQQLAARDVLMIALATVAVNVIPLALVTVLIVV